MPGYFTNTVNLCQVYQDLKNPQATNLVKIFVEKYAPNGDEFLEKHGMFHACPYVVSWRKLIPSFSVSKNLIFKGKSLDNALS
jgi:hypothetical protein